MYLLWIGSFLPFNLAAQKQIALTDKESKEVIEGVYLLLETKNSKKYSKLSDPQGKVIFNDSILCPCELTIQHLNYETFQIKLHSFESQAISLTPVVHNLDHIVVTGQYEPQSAENSVYQIRTISSERIKSQGALRLDELFRNELNIRLNKDLATGTTGMQLQGIGGQNVKILVDGIPLTGRVGNATDLEQINTNNIEKIEIIEGPMAVNYGADALAGVVNIITRKQAKEKINLKAQVQTESIGNEIGLNEGVHNQNVSGGFNLSEKIYTQIDLGRNFFGGFRGLSTGRQRDWSPKTQWLGSALMKYKINQWNIFYRMDYLDELIEVPGAVQTTFAIDENYHTQRWINQLQAGGEIEKFSRFHLQFSYSDYQREKRRFSKDLSTLQETLTTAEGDQDLTYFRDWVLRGTLNNFQFIHNPKFQIELGYDINLQKGGGGRIEGDKRQMNDFAFFSSAELHLFEKITLRPGLRIAYNTIYNAPLIPSFHVKYNFTKSASLRFSYGRGFRAPALRELYFIFVDASHNVYGNENLKPEYAHHFDTHLSKRFNFSSRHNYEIQLTGFYNTIDNQIDLAGGFSDPQGRPAFRYVNISKFKSLGLNFLHTFVYQHLKINAGLSYIGRYNPFIQERNDLKNFLYAFESNAQVIYHLKKWKTRLNVFYKYTGRLPQYSLDENSNIFLSQIDDFHWLDATVSKNFIGSLDIQLGVKNLLNITRVNSSSTGGIHTGGPLLPVGYGRSFFLSLNYLFHSKN